MLPDYQTLCELYAYPDPMPPTGWVRGCMISSVDGSSVGASGRSGDLGTSADRRVLRLLRGLADVVLVGACTVREEGYGLPDLFPEHVADRAGLGQSDVASLAVVTRSGSLPERLLQDVRLDPRETFQRGHHPLVVLTTESAPAPELRQLRNQLGSDAVVVCGERQVDPRSAVAALVGLDLGRILCEGGPTWLGQLAAAGMLNELALTISPLLTAGDGPRIINGPPIWQHLALAHAIPDAGTLVTRWLAVEEQGSAGS